MQVNNQPIEQQIRDEDWVQPEPVDLDVFDIWPTVQGEGPLAGCPATFVRLAGCNFKCHFCDTDYTSKRAFLSCEEILERCALPLVVLTGGEPFRQPLYSLCSTLLRAGKTVQIETNGSLFQPLPEPWSDDDPGACLVVVCSPKSAHIHPELVPWITNFKYVLEAGHVDPDDGLPTNILGGGCRPARPPEDWEPYAECDSLENAHAEVFLQPLDVQDPEQNAANVRAVVESCMKYNYRICLQTHKILGLP